ncbi:glycoside hydrolase family 73 protein [Acidithiobacillus thiooxidans]|uniref:Mannosyl-glycoprotein endo-beta-N-acetylglucosamidase-like domain-containing protein n=1 Tax=Acidithiobacillus thiooxidans TaxID=930 RepID=A0A1C2I845_ACITH|nr:glucosaminidase domain-containing protein [Acidithiobacillus thiooxidans]OCX72165.1 hypothetical protein A6M23_10235 [Acidithiobacillus thiooxidans]OCX83878.1 hypothetical protein A6P08_09705 [Acidithiobacillus thiooxidans]
MAIITEALKPVPDSLATSQLGAVSRSAPPRKEGGAVTSQSSSEKKSLYFQKEMQAAQKFAAMFLDEVLQETMPNMFGSAVGAQSYQSMFIQSLASDMTKAGSGIGLMSLLEKSLHIPASAVKALQNQPAMLSSDSTVSGLSGRSAPNSADAQAFVKTLMPLVTEAGHALGVAPRLIMAQIALETGWGRSVVGNNLFGIKATPGASSVLADTHEADADGQLCPTIAAFRAFPDVSACIHYYVELLKAQYPGAVGVGDNMQAFAQGLVQGHYATDPDYAQKLVSLAQSPLLAGMP